MGKSPSVGIAPSAWANKLAQSLRSRNVPKVKTGYLVLLCLGQLHRWQLKLETQLTQVSRCAHETHRASQSCSQMCQKLIRMLLP